MLDCRKFLTAILAAALLSGCGMAQASRDTPTAALPVNAAYTLWPGDRLKVAVFNEADLTGEFQVDERGHIAFPLVGEIKASGMTLDQFRQELSTRLRRGYVRNPSITLEVLNYRPINIIGEVKKAGQYAYRPGMTLLDIPAIAGGHTYRADKDIIHIVRLQGGQTIKTDAGNSSVAILPGDTIKIPERFF